MDDGAEAASMTEALLYIALHFTSGTGFGADGIRLNSARAVVGWLVLSARLFAPRRAILSGGPSVIPASLSQVFIESHYGGILVSIGLSRAESVGQHVR